MSQTVSSADAPNDAPADSQGEPQEPEYKQGISITQVAIALIAIGAFAFFQPSTAKTVAIFIVTLSVLVFVHEWGHYQFARWAGMKVNRFAIGFPPFIYTKRVNDVDYSIGALPIGGMVDIAGLGSEEEMVGTMKGEAATPVANPARPRGQKQFQDANLGWRFLTLFAGPLMNFIFAIVISVALFSVIGTPDLTNAKENRVAQALNGYPAAQAGVRANDLVVGVNGTPTDDPNRITEIIRKSAPGQAVTFQIKRDGQSIDVPVVPQMQTDESKSGATAKVPMVGIAFDVDWSTITKYNRVGVYDATRIAFANAFGMSAQILNLVKRAFTFKLTNTDKGGVGGPVAIANVLKSSTDSGYYPMLLTAAALSINLGLLNLLPLPALDGGRILFLGYELVMRRPLDPRKEGLVHAAGMVLLLAFMLFITLRDVMPMFSR